MPVVASCLEEGSVRPSHREDLELVMFGTDGETDIAV